MPAGGTCSLGVSGVCIETVFLVVLPDEDGQCGLGPVPERGRGSSRRGEDHALCTA